MKCSGSFYISEQDCRRHAADILYIKASVNDCYIHVTSGSVYKTRSTLEAMETQIGEYFLKVHRTYLVCIMAIHALEDTLTLINGEEINYATRRKIYSCRCHKQGFR